MGLCSSPRPVAGCASGSRMITGRGATEARAQVARSVADEPLGLGERRISDDDRALGFDGTTHSFQIGGDFSTIGGLLLGAIYSYSSQDLESEGLDADSDIDSHFVSVYLSKNFANWFNVGVVGGYGSTDVDTQLRNPSQDLHSDFDTWTVTPFLGVAHTWGAFSASVSASYMWSYADRDSERFMTDLTLGYAITDSLSISGSAKYNNVTDAPESAPGLSEDDEWVTFGGKASYRITEMFGVYAAYEYDAFNTNYENHSMRGGLTLAF
ncbi:MAG: autotransporter domain-containing protein [Verrucomicrobiota bacterium]|nr:autotransporter domain-containing protein [Verrucomicrobiota bacterium]